MSRSPTKANPQGEDRSVLVAIPCLNEGATVARVVEGVPRQIAGVRSVHVLVIDDGSDDDTAEQARAAGAEVLSHRSNQGLGSTFREAVEVALARGIDILVNIDGDGQFDSADIPLLVEPVARNDADMATASRFLQPDLRPEMPGIKRWGNRGVSRIVNLLTGESFQDVSCGFRAFSKEALLRMNLFGSFTYTQEAFLDLVFKDLAIVEIPVKVRGTREFGDSRIASSIPRYAIRSLQIMARAFISYRPFAFFAIIAIVFMLAGVALLGFLGVHYLRTHAFSPHIWAGFVGGSFSFLGILTFVIGFVGDMLVRMRMNQETILYHQRRTNWERARAALTTDPDPS